MTQPLWRMVWSFLKWLELPCDPRIPPLGVCPRETKTLGTHKASSVTVHSTAVDNNKTVENLNVHQWNDKIWCSLTIQYCLKIKWSTDTRCDVDKSENHEAESHRSPSWRPHTVWFHVHEMSRTDKSMEIESRLVVASGQKARETANGQEFKRWWKCSKINCDLCLHHYVNAMVKITELYT